MEYIRRIDRMGGMVPAIELGFPQREIAEASYRYQREVETGGKIVVGVNAFESTDEEAIELLRIDQSAQASQIRKLERLRGRRDRALVGRTLDALQDAARGSQNTMPFILSAVRAYATVGEICGALRDVFGSFQEACTV